MAVYQETKNVPRPVEIFPGVPDWRMDIAPVGPAAPPLTPGAEDFLVSLTQRTNRFFDEISRHMAPGDHNEFFNVHTTQKPAERLLQKTAEAVHGVTKDYSNVHLVFFPAGSIPIAKKIQDMGYPSHRMHALDISGSQGTVSGSAVVNGTLPYELLEPTHDIVITEDVIDSVDTIFKFISARSDFRDPKEAHKSWLRALGDRLRAAHDNHNNGPDAYEDFARAAREEHVAILSVWSKNQQARDALRDHESFAVHSEDTIQKELLDRYSITSLPTRLWALGGNYAMDTGVRWSRIVPFLPRKLRTDPRVTQYMKTIADNEIREWLIRAVRIGPLAYFESKEQEKNVLTYIGKVASEILNHEVD